MVDVAEVAVVTAEVAVAAEVMRKVKKAAVAVINNYAPFPIRH